MALLEQVTQPTSLCHCSGRQPDRLSNCVSLFSGCGVATGECITDETGSAEAGGAALGRGGGTDGRQGK